MPRFMRFCKMSLSWLVVVAGILAATFVLGVLGARPIPYRHSQEFWIIFLLIAIFGFALMIASVVALRNPFRAMIVCVVSAPLLAIVSLKYYFVANAQIPTSDPDNRQWALDTYAEFRANNHHDLINSLIWIGIIFGGLAVFWLIADKLEWPRIISQRPTTISRKLTLSFSTALLFCLMICATSFAWAIWPREPRFSVDCNGGFPSAAQRSPEEVGAVAKVVYLIGSTAPYQGRHRSPSALAVVQEYFWGLPLWNHKWIFLTDGIFEKGEQLLVLGKSQNGILTRFFSFVSVAPCSRTALVEDREVDLRVMREGPPKTGVRIIGLVIRYVDEHMNRAAVPGTKVIIEGPTGTMTIISDQHGIYEVSGLPPGHYLVHADVFDQRFKQYPSCGDREENNLKAGDVWGCTLALP
jgi:hypothetical protein